MSSDSPRKPDSSVQEAPAWVDKTLIENALRSEKEVTNPKVKEISIERATAPGDNYGSIIYRIRVQLVDDAKECSLLLKTTPSCEAIANAVIKSGIFQHEINMLAKHIPAMHKLLERAAPGRFPPLAARCLLHGSSPSPFLVLEDLKPQGFRLADRHRGLGLRHSLIAMRTLARFHAASAALLSTDPSISNEFPNPFVSSGGSWCKFITSSFEATADMCRTLVGMEEYAETLETLKSSALAILRNLNNPRPEKFNVLLHGDFWINNMMFNYHENGQLKDFRLVDLQVSHVASPCIDIQYFLHTSLSDDVYDNHTSLLIREYHTILTETLELLGMSGPSLEELLADLNENSFHALYGAVVVSLIVRSEIAPDLNAIFAGEASKIRSMHENTTRKLWLKRVLPEFRRKGWL